LEKNEHRKMTTQEKVIRIGTGWVILLTELGINLFLLMLYLIKLIWNLK